MVLDEDGGRVLVLDVESRKMTTFGLVYLQLRYIKTA